MFDTLEPVEAMDSSTTVADFLVGCSSEVLLICGFELETETTSGTVEGLSYTDDRGTLVALSHWRVSSSHLLPSDEIQQFSTADHVGSLSVRRFGRCDWWDIRVIIPALSLRRMPGSVNHSSLYPSCGSATRMSTFHVGNHASHAKAIAAVELQ